MNPYTWYGKETTCPHTTGLVEKTVDLKAHENNLRSRGSSDTLDNGSARLLMGGIDWLIFLLSAGMFQSYLRLSDMPTRECVIT